VKGDVHADSRHNLPVEKLVQADTGVLDGDTETAIIAHVALDFGFRIGPRTVLRLVSAAFAAKLVAYDVGLLRDSTLTTAHAATSCKRIVAV
jgi:hypothetical protein